MIELKPCPFCGYPVTLSINHKGEIIVYCSNRHYFQYCDEFYFSYGRGDEDEVIREWNSRWKEGE